MKWLDRLIPGFLLLLSALVGAAWHARTATKHEQKALKHEAKAERLKADRHLRAAAEESKHVEFHKQVAADAKGRATSNIEKVETIDPSLTDVIDAFNKRLRDLRPES